MNSIYDNVFRERQFSPSMTLPPEPVCDHDDVCTVSGTRIDRLMVKCNGCRRRTKWPWVTVKKCRECKKSWHADCFPAERSRPLPENVQPRFTVYEALYITQMLQMYAAEENSILRTTGTSSVKVQNHSVDGSEKQSSIQAVESLKNDGIDQQRVDVTKLLEVNRGNAVSTGKKLKPLLEVSSSSVSLQHTYEDPSAETELIALRQELDACRARSKETMDRYEEENARLARKVSYLEDRMSEMTNDLLCPK